MIAMKTSKQIKQPKPVPPPSRSVKIADDIHYQCRVLAAERRMGIQEFIEEVLVDKLRRMVTK
jgi:hypothetical protein